MANRIARAIPPEWIETLVWAGEEDRPSFEKKKGREEIGF
jgi:hypothetical protein